MAGEIQVLRGIVAAVIVRCKFSQTACYRGKKIWMYKQMQNDVVKKGNIITLKISLIISFEVLVW